MSVINQNQYLEHSGRTSHTTSISSLLRHSPYFNMKFKPAGIRSRSILKMVVPTISHVIPGAAVSIVLKADQRTGRQVQGTVKDVLTSGNHPRGIKVRLSDGRIGRVQQMSDASPVAASTPEAHQAIQSELQRDLAIQQRVRGPDRGGSGRKFTSERLKSRYTDMRLDEGAEQPPEELDLMAFVKPAKQKKRNQKATKQESPPPAPPTEVSEAVPASSLTTTCPVCGNFEGDEVAVAHHVGGHFT